MKNTNNNVYEMVTNKIVAEMEKGIIPWQRPWNAGEQAISHTSGKPYSWLNQMLLGFKAGEWLTFNQCKAEGGCIKAGEKASTVVFWSFLDKKVQIENEDGEIETKVLHGRPFLKYYHVFHIDQCTGIKAKHPNKATLWANDPIDAAEDVVTSYFDREACTLEVRQSERAFYSPSFDKVVVPARAQYEVTEEYYSTLFHEMTHSTGHESRLNRLTKTAAFGSDDYSKEELVAEMGSAMLVAKVGIDCEKAFRNSVAYIQGWLKALKDDSTMLVAAAGKAEKAVKYILNEGNED